MELVEGLEVGVHGLVAFPGFRDHHHDGVGQFTAGHDEHFEAVIEHGGVGAVGIYDGDHLLDVVAEEGTFEQHLSGVHPVAVTAESIDFAVMGEEAVGVATVPAGEGIRAEPGVHEGEGAGEFGVLEVGVIGWDLFGHEHALVEHGPAGEAADKEMFIAGEIAVADGLFGDLTDDVEASFEGGSIGDVSASADEELSHDGFAVAGGLTQAGVVGGDGTPSEDCLAVVGDGFFESFLAAFAVGGVLGQVDHGHAVLFLGWQVYSCFCGGLFEEVVRGLD